jgi:hypothetical protein
MEMYPIRDSERQIDRRSQDLDRQRKGQFLTNWCSYGKQGLRGTKMKLR